MDKNADIPERKDRVCLFWENEHGERKKYTYSEMKSLSNRFGNVLWTLGLKKGDLKKNGVEIRRFFFHQSS